MPHLRRRHRFSSANSINIGRLLPQMVYYVASSLEIAAAHRAKPSYIIPAGNLGNAFAAVWARAMGFPLGRIVLAHNLNRTVPDFLETRLVAAAPEHRDAGLRDGRRQSEQHGARPRALSDPGCDARTVERGQHR